MLQNWKHPKVCEQAGLSAKDKVFLKTLIELFTDEKNAAICSRVRSGHFALQYNPANGEAHVIDLAIDAPAPSAGEVIHFFAGFSQAEWEKLRPHRAALLNRFQSDRASAFRLVEQILGQGTRVPKAKALAGE